MKAKTMAIFLAITLMFSMMAVMPAQAAASYNMEEWTTATEDAISVPVGFTVVPGTGAQITCDTNDVAGNTSKKMKIVHTEETTTTVSVSLNLTKATTGYESGAMEVYWDFYLASLESEGENKGVMLDLDRLQDRNTAYFQDTTYTHWRKMMVYDLDLIWNTGVTVTFSGKGTLYLDDIRVETMNIVVNGGFEGLHGDGILANSVMENESATNGWKRSSGTIKHYKKTDETMPTDAGTYFVESAEGNYIMVVNGSRAVSLQYNDRAPIVTSGTTYKVTVSHKASKVTDGGCGFSTWSGLSNLPTGISAHWAKGTTDWADKSYTTVYDFGTTTNYGIGMCLHSRLGTGTAYFDDLRIEAAKEGASLTDSEGNVKNALENKTTMTAKYEMPVWDTEKDVYANLADGSESTKKITVIAVLYEKNGDALRIEDIQISADVAGEILTTPSWGGNTDGYYDLGFLPASANFDIAVPETGDYELKLFAWDSVGGLKPISENTYTYQTAAEV